MSERLLWVKNIILIIAIVLILLSFRNLVHIVLSIAFLVFLIVIDYFREQEPRRSVF